jgi:hypothetical protein
MPRQSPDRAGSRNRLHPYSQRSSTPAPAVEPSSVVTSSDANAAAISPVKPLTLRLSEIPVTIQERQLREFLNSLEYEARPQALGNAFGNEKNVLALSLAPYIDWLVATVTFRHVPWAFARCQPRRMVYFDLPPELSAEESGVTVTVDCDFYGITPLYQPAQPEFE